MKKQIFDFCNKAKYFKQLRKCTKCQRNIFGYMMTYKQDDKIKFIDPDVWVDNNRISCRSYIKK